MLNKMKISPKEKYEYCCCTKNLINNMYCECNKENAVILCCVPCGVIYDIFESIPNFFCNFFLIFWNSVASKYPTYGQFITN